jgi:hypothetical protein
MSGSAGLSQFIAWVADTAANVDSLKVTLEPVRAPHWVRGVERARGAPERKERGRAARVAADAHARLARAAAAHSQTSALRSTCVRGGAAGRRERERVEFDAPLPAGRPGRPARRRPRRGARRRGRGRARAPGSASAGCTMWASSGDRLYLPTGRSLRARPSSTARYPRKPDPTAGAHGIRVCCSARGARRGCAVDVRRAQECRFDG